MAKCLGGETTEGWGGRGRGVGVGERFGASGLWGEIILYYITYNMYKGFAEGKKLQSRGETNRIFD